MKITGALTRREWMQAAGAITLGTGAGCAARRTAMVKIPPAAPQRAFARVKVAPERVIRTVVGLRPFRPSGFVLRAENRGSKTIIHDYGHGGGGMTLSWGTAHLAVEEALKTGQRKFAVLGCGGVGLATARLLQRHGLDVTIYARDLPPGTTSNIAGAQWAPALAFDEDKAGEPFLSQFNRAARLSYRYYQDLLGDYYGVHWIENYVLSSSAPAQGPRPGGASFNAVDDLFRDARDLGPKEHPFPVPYVHRFTTMLIEPPIYLNAVMRDFLLSGGRIVVREFRSVEEVLALDEPVVMNCTGLGAKALFGDEELTPVKGQLSILLPQPEVDYITIGPEDLYMFPRKDGVLLGGTHERGVWTLDPNQEAAQHVIAGHTKIFSEMRV